MEKYLVTNLLRELVELGYGKNGKLIIPIDHKKLKTDFRRFSF